MYDDLSKHVVLLSVMEHAVHKKKAWVSTFLSLIRCQIRATVTTAFDSENLHFLIVFIRMLHSSIGPDILTCTSFSNTLLSSLSKCHNKRYSLKKPHLRLQNLLPYKTYGTEWRYTPFTSQTCDAATGL